MKAFQKAFYTLAAAALATQGSIHAQNRFSQHNLVSDVPGLADRTDGNLVNPWGIALSRTSPFWISNNRAGDATVYDSQGQPFPASGPLNVRVAAPPSGAPVSRPTGQVFNDTTGFNVAFGKLATFIFATEDGTISGWNSGLDPQNSVLLVDNSGAGAVYKGLALATTDAGPRLYAANFSLGTIDVFDANLAPVTAAGGFADPGIPAGFAPFNIQKIGRKLYVTYAMQDGARHNDVAGAGNGFINVFDFDGNLLGRLISQGGLNSPWGLALAPSYFGAFSNALLVGNFGDGTINAYDSCNGQYLGTLADPNGNAVSIPGLWGLAFGNGRNGGDANTLYFTAGIPGTGAIQDHGLFGSLQVADSPAAPAPQTAALDIANFSFMPDPVNVKAGAQLTWTNQDSALHTIVADDGSFQSTTLNKGQKFSQTVAAPGSHSYHCSIHPFMKGTIVVQ